MIVQNSHFQPSPTCADRAEAFDKVAAEPAPVDPLPADDLPALLWLSAAGDHVALRLLYDREGPFLYAVCLRVTADEALATEALYETFMQIWRRSVQYRSECGTAEGWLVSQVRQRSLEILRRRQRGGVPSDVFRREAELDVGLGRLNSTRRSKHMGDAMMQLDSTQREILVLSFLDGMSSAELAQKLRLPIGTIKALTRRSLALLKSALESVP